MQLISLFTQNFKRLGTFECDFTLGLNVIAGDNARGKSTLLQAIEAALFGVTVVPGKKENIPTWGQKDFSVTLRFALDGEQFEVTRNKSTAKLIRVEGGKHGDALVANGNTPVTAHIEQLLGLSAKDYSLFVQSKQHEAAGVLTFGATALNRKVEEFAGVDLIDKIQILAQRRATTLSGRAEGLQVSDEKIAELEQEVASCAGLLKKAEDELADHQFALDGLEPVAIAGPAVSSADLLAQQRAVERKAAELKLAEQSVVSAKSALETAQAQLAKEKQVDVESLEQQLKAIAAEGRALKETADELADLASRKRVARQALDSVQGELADADTAFAKAGGVKGLEDVQDAASKAKDAQAVAAGKEADAAAAVRSLSALAAGAKCPTCGQAKDDHDPEKLAAELEQAKDAHDLAKQEAKLTTDTLSIVATTLRALERLQQQRDDSIERRDRAQARYDAIQDVTQEAADQAAHEHQTKREEYAQAKAGLDVVAAANERYSDAVRAVGRAERELEECEDHVTEVAADPVLSAAPVTDEDVALAQRQEAALADARSEHRNKETQLRSAVSAAKQNVKHQSDYLVIAEKRLAESREQIAQGRELIAQAKKAERLVRYLRDTRQQYMQDVWATINAVSSKLVRQASKDSITQILNQDGEFVFEEEGVLAPVSSASGAQKGFIGTALRIGLTRALYGSDSLMIFDEPTESCSEHNASSMAATLATSAKQTLLITHRENDQVLAENIINVGE